MNRGRKLVRKVSRAIARGDLNVDTVKLRWRDQPADAGTYDPVLDAGNPAFEPVEMEQDLKAFVHYVSIHTTNFQRFSQVQAGDVIVDFPGDVKVGDSPETYRDIDVLKGLEFEIGGILYVQKDGGEDLAKCWDVRVAGVPITRTLLLKKKG